MSIGFQKLIIAIGFDNKSLAEISDLAELVTWGESRDLKFTIDDLMERAVFVLRSDASSDTVAILHFDTNGDRANPSLDINIAGGIFFDFG